MDRNRLGHGRILGPTASGDRDTGSTVGRREWLACCAALAGGLALSPRALTLKLPAASPLPSDDAQVRLCFNENPHGPPSAAVRAAEAALVGERSPLDSLGLVTLIVAAEEKMEQAFGVSLTLVDEAAGPWEESPFLTLSTLADHLLARLEGRDA